MTDLYERYIFAEKSKVREEKILDCVESRVKDENDKMRELEKRGKGEK